jgi:hypothetical protein
MTEDSRVVFIHEHSRERVIAIVLHASVKWKIHVRWPGLGGTYWFYIPRNELIHTENSRKVIPWWHAEDIKQVTRMWKQIVYPGKRIEEGSDKRLAMLRKVEAEVMREPSANAMKRYP